MKVYDQSKMAFALQQKSRDVGDMYADITSAASSQKWKPREMFSRSKLNKAGSAVFQAKNLRIHGTMYTVDDENP